MKKILSLALLLAPAALFAQQADDSVVQWERIVGVITAPNVDNPVAGIKAGAGPWTTRDGHARIDLLSGRASFDVEGLVLVGGNSSGTPGPVTTLNGTLVCNAGTGNQANHRHGGSQTEFRGQCALPWTTRRFAGGVRQSAVSGPHRTQLARGRRPLARHGGGSHLRRSLLIGLAPVAVSVRGT